MRSVLVIPDTQLRHGVARKHLRWVGRCIADVQPDYVVQLGDWFDHPSISQYNDRASGRRYQRDVDAGLHGMLELLEAVEKHSRGYKASWHFLTGNHEHRMRKYLAEHPELDGAIQDPMHDLDAWGWKVSEFLEPITIMGVRFCHYFPRSARGNVMQDRNGAPDARAQCLREMVSCTAGHQQGFSYYEHPIHDQTVQSMIVGSCYAHEEGYLTPQGTRYFKGIVVKRFSRHDGGRYDFERLSLGTLRERYE